MLKTLLNVLDLTGFDCRACRKPILATDAFGVSEGVCAACVADEQGRSPARRPGPP
jgi:hypothetical protein